MGNNYSYKIQINGQQRADYAVAVEEVMRRWEREGYLKDYPGYSSILLHTCYSGRAEHQAYILTNFHKAEMRFANDNKYINAYSERTSNGMLYLTLYTCQPRKHYLSRRVNNTSASQKFAGRNIKICGR